MTNHSPGAAEWYRIRECQLCGEPFSLFAPRHDNLGTPMHRVCALREVLGGIGHLTDHQRWCVEAGDPDMGLSYYQSALRVDDWVHEHGTDAAARLQP